MDTNGHSQYSALAGRVADLELALRVLTRRWEETLTPRLLAIEEELERIYVALDLTREQ